MNELKISGDNIIMFYTKEQTPLFTFPSSLDFLSLSSVSSEDFTAGVELADTSEFCKALEEDRLTASNSSFSC